MDGGDVLWSRKGVNGNNTLVVHNIIIYYFCVATLVVSVTRRVEVF